MTRDPSYVQLIDTVAHRFVDFYGQIGRAQHTYAWTCLAAQDRLVNLFVSTCTDEDVASAVLRIAEIRDGLRHAEKLLQDALKDRPRL